MSVPIFWKNFLINNVMTREETVAAYKACMIILTRREGAAMRDTNYTGDLSRYASDTRHNMNIMAAIFKINEALDLNALDTETIGESSKMGDEKAALIISAMDNVTAIKAYLAMLVACYALGSPTSEQIDWFNVFGKLHGLTFNELKQLVTNAKR